MRIDYEKADRRRSEEAPVTMTLQSFHVYDECDVEAADDEQRELVDRVTKWLRESAKPASIPSGFPDANVEDGEQINGKGAKSVEGVETQEISGTSIVLYHPDFADWRTCSVQHERHEPNQASEESSPIHVANILDGAHSALSNLFKF
jgi:hypothetical protein